MNEGAAKGREHCLYLPSQYGRCYSIVIKSLDIYSHVYRYIHLMIIHYCASILKETNGTASIFNAGAANSPNVPICKGSLLSHILFTSFEQLKGGYHAIKVFFY